jgi:hypothetical protein
MGATVEKIDRVYFASVTDALIFAFNFEGQGIPSPVMNRAMAEGLPKRPEGGQSRSDAVTPSQAPKRAPAGGLKDQAVLVGWVLHQVHQLPMVHQHIITARYLRPRKVCSCGRACCRGWEIKRDWVEAIRHLVEYLKLHAEVTKEPGKRGFSTDPRLRVALVEDYFRHEKKRLSLTELMAQTETTSVTVAKHRTWIFDHLQAQENQAMADISLQLDQCGLVGQLIL